MLSCESVVLVWGVWGMGPRWGGWVRWVYIEQTVQLQDDIDTDVQTVSGYDPVTVTVAKACNLPLLLT